MKDKGIFRSIKKAVTGIFKNTKNYPDPVLRAPDLFKKPGRHKRKNDSRPMLRRGNLGPPPCDPGTITYHDMLVRKFGRRMADYYNECIDLKMMDSLPTATELYETNDWAWRP